MLRGYGVAPQRRTFVTGAVAGLRVNAACPESNEHLAMEKMDLVAERRLHGVEHSSELREYPIVAGTLLDIQSTVRE
jgi:hypothetical protein